MKTKRLTAVVLVFAFIFSFTSANAFAFAYGVSVRLESSEICRVVNVTVPTCLPLVTVGDNVYTAKNAVISNNTDGKIKISSVSINDSVFNFTDLIDSAGNTEEDDAVIGYGETFDIFYGSKFWVKEIQTHETPKIVFIVSCMEVEEKV